MKYFCIFMRIGFYQPASRRISIGGVQTYMYDLARLSAKLGFQPVVYEMNNEGKSNSYDYEGIHIRQISARGRNYSQKCFNKVFAERREQNCLFVISTDQLSIRSAAPNVLSIQHGIAFDEPIRKWYAPVLKMLKCWRNVGRAQMTRNLVCVDYNFYNWYRTLGTLSAEHTMTVIPNYTQGAISSEELEAKLMHTKRRKVLFARRFVEHRGALLFADVAEMLLREFPDVEVTFAGRGPLEETLRRRFADESRVVFTTYEAKDSLSFHTQYDISVVPTIFSEGTSLSLCEAMSAGCYCVATHVGGLTNILLDGFNGRLVAPETNEVYMSVRDALTCEFSVYKSVCRNAYTSAVAAFSKDRWQEKWQKLIEKIETSAHHE